MVISFFKKLFTSQHRLAILIPYRDREAHLAEFVPYMKGFFQKHHPNLPLQIYVIEQTHEKLFNRGKLMNAGFTIAKNNCDYICFHDVDMLPEEGHCNYSYSPYPTQLATYLDRWDYQVPRADGWDVRKFYWGGVTLFPNDCYELINGFSNDYWGWGSEDMDLHQRCLHQGIFLKRRNGRYTCLDHKRADKQSPSAVKNRIRQKTISNIDNICEEGLNNLEFKVLGEKTLETDVFFITVEI